jgi:transposase
MMKTAYLGVDVSKGYADFVLIDQHLNILSNPLQFDDTYTGHQKCEQWLSSCIKTHKLTQIRAAVESTGGLENNWLAGFKKMLPGFDLHMIRLNPATVKFASKASLSTVTTDAESALHIAQYLVRFGQSLTYQVADSRYVGFKKVLTQLNQFTKMSTASKNLLRLLVYEVFPESQALFGQQLPNWGMELLKKYPSPTRLARAKPVVVARIKGITLQKAEQIIELAKNSIGSAAGAESELVLSQQLRQISNLKEQINELKAYLSKHVNGPEIDLLTSITGIGTYSAAVIMIQIGDITRFSSPKKLASFFGLVPQLRESGDKKGKSTMSKKGSSLLRATLYMCAKSAVVHDAHLRTIYTRRIANGETYNQVIGVIMHKLIRIIWGVLTSQTAYDPTIDQKNQHHTVPNAIQLEQQLLNKRREQAFDPIAPVSNRTRKKRKEHLLSQAESIGQVRDLESVPIE